MNPPRYLSGFLKVMGLDSDWRRFFDLTRTGLQRSFLTIPLSLPFYYLCALALHQQRSLVLASNPDGGASAPVLIAPLPFVLICLAFGFSFSALAFAVSRAFGKADTLRAWITIRHWGFFFMIVLASFLLGLTFIGLVTFPMVLPFLFILYLGTLAVDIRIAQKVADFDWGGAILVGCMITALGLSIILMGMNYLA